MIYLLLFRKGKDIMKTSNALSFAVIFSGIENLIKKYREYKYQKQLVSKNVMAIKLEYADAKRSQNPSKYDDEYAKVIFKELRQLAEMNKDSEVVYANSLRAIELIEREAKIGVYSTEDVWLLCYVLKCFKGVK